MLEELFREQMTLSNVKFFIIGVARDFNDFHPVQQWPWNRVQAIGGGNEEDFGQVIL